MSWNSRVWIISFSSLCPSVSSVVKLLPESSPAQQDNAQVCWDNETMPSAELESRNPKLETDLREVAQDIVARAMAGGATAAECVVREGDEFSTLVRLGQVETLKESGSKSIGVRVFFGQRAASTYSSDFSREGLDRMLKSALELARITSEDPFGGIPEASQLGQLSGNLDLFHEDVYSLAGADRIDYARRAEKAALDFDPRIKNSEGGSFDAATGHKILANSHGFVGEYRRSYCSVAAVPIAQNEDGAMQRDYWYSVARTLTKLDSPEQVGKVAGRTNAAPSGREKSEDRKGADRVRSDGFDLDSGAHFRRHQRRLGLSWRVVPGRQAGTENCR